MTVLTVVGSVLAGIIALIVVIVYEPPPPPPPPPPSYADLVVRSAGLLRHDSGDRADLYAIVRNPNANAGVRAVDYTFEVSAGGQSVARISGKTYFMPGQEKPIVALNEAVQPEGTAVTLRFDDPDWATLGAGVQPPSLVTVNRVAVLKPGSPPIYEVKAVLANESSLDYLTVEVTALGFDPGGAVVGAGRTFVGSLRSGERREFTVSWPLPPGREVAETRIVPEVNVFSKSAVLPRPGVPGQEPRPRSTPQQ